MHRIKKKYGLKKAGKYFVDYNKLEIYEEK
jgi:hypothetical protein